MKFLLCFVIILPYVWCAEVGSIECPDGRICPFGKTCCQASIGFTCCDLPEDDRQNKKLVAAVPSSSFSNASYLLASDTQIRMQNGMNGNCHGTWCHYPLCCQRYTNAVCCNPVNKCCPPDSNCCSNSVGTWCCLNKSRCLRSYGYCRAGAASLSSAIVSFFMMFIILKYFV